MLGTCKLQRRCSGPAAQGRRHAVSSPGRGPPGLPTCAHWELAALCSWAGSWGLVSRKASPRVHLCWGRWEERPNHSPRPRSCPSSVLSGHPPPTRGACATCSLHALHGGLLGPPWTYVNHGEPKSPGNRLRRGDYRGGKRRLEQGGGLPREATTRFRAETGQGGVLEAWRGVRLGPGWQGRPARLV